MSLLFLVCSPFPSLVSITSGGVRVGEEKKIMKDLFGFFFLSFSLFCFFLFLIQVTCSAEEGSEVPARKRRSLCSVAPCQHTDWGAASLRSALHTAEGDRSQMGSGAACIGEYRWWEEWYWKHVRQLLSLGRCVFWQRNTRLCLMACDYYEYVLLINSPH